MNTEEMDAHISYLLTELKNSYQREKIMVKALQKISNEDIDNIHGESAAIADGAMLDVLNYF